VTIKFIHEKLKNKDFASSNEGGSTFVACTSKAMFDTSSIDYKLNIKKEKKKDLCKKSNIGYKTIRRR
jgi:hypothetical protein